MTSIALFRDQYLRIEGRMVAFERRDACRNLVFLDVANSSPFVVREDELLDLMARGQAYRVGGAEERAFKEGRKSDLTSLAQLQVDEDLKARTLRRVTYVQAWERSGLKTRKRQELVPVIEATAAVLNDRHPPQPGTLQSWITEWEKSGRDFQALMDRIAQRGRRGSQQKLDAQNLFDETVEGLFLNSMQYDVSNVYRQVRDVFTRRNRLTGDTWVPSYSTVYRKIKTYDRYVATANRKGVAVADRIYRPKTGHVSTERHHERTELDLLKTDLIVVDKDGNPIDRPVVIIAYDHFSRMPVGRYIGFEQSVAAAIECIHHATYPKTYVKEKYPDIKGAWPCWGLSENYFADLGSQFVANDFSAMLKLLGCNITFAARETPNDKAAIEQFFGTFTRSLVRYIPGRTFEDFYRRRNEETVEMQPVVTLEELDYLVHRWIIEVYSQQFHTGINDAPHRRWLESVARHHIIPLPEPEVLKAAFCLTTHRRLFDYGVRVNNLIYNGPEIAAIRTSPAYNPGGTVMCKIDPKDLGAIQVYDPGRERFVTVQQSPGSRRMFDARGVTLVQQTLALKLIKARPEKYSEDNVAAAHADLQRYIQDKHVPKDRKVRRLKAAYGVPKHQIPSPINPALSDLSISDALEQLPDSVLAGEFTIPDEDDNIGQDFTASAPTPEVLELLPSPTEPVASDLSASGTNSSASSAARFAEMARRMGVTGRGGNKDV
ncbi:Mu transposase C-terminal domain-containing protein [Nitrospirillum sp. BR 11163]|uniref:Mu transposase C-terminal domain-containing protein n=1 Tax=Nitrospirillum sp. BR 11163 TaxID=3104323 RepID=UPI002B001B8F|nr:Mu transposase C-terminal domain-containing protein [Nitrospirillum sp. BR 11163]MEA1673970.1 Mu transposase C-terminal domain-containing protein [Nitrospirillum sp. BR 11163]